MRKELFRERSIEETYHIVRDVKETLNKVQNCDQCKEPLHALVTKGLEIFCSVKCAYETLDDTPHVEKASILDETPRKRSEDSDIGIVT